MCQIGYIDLEQLYSILYSTHKEVISLLHSITKQTQLRRCDTWEDMNITISMPSLVPTDDKIVKYENSFGPRVQELLGPWVLPYYL